MTAENDICQSLIDRYADWPLLASASLTLRDHYIPFLVNYTREDDEAKGLRKLADPSAARPPIHMSALEVIAKGRAVVIHGRQGAGKTSLALDLALSLAGERRGRADFNLARLSRDLPRNDLGDRAQDGWKGPPCVPLYLPIAGPCTLDDLLDRDAPSAKAWLDQAEGPPVLLIIDGAERAAEMAEALIADLTALLDRSATARVLILGRTDVCSAWVLPPGFDSYALRPLLDAQRRDPATPDAAPLWPTRPDLYILARALGGAPSPAFRLVDLWLEKDPHVTETTAPFLAARRLDGKDAIEIAAAFAADPVALAEPLTILAERWTSAGRPIQPLVAALASLPGIAGLHGALAAADVLLTQGESVGWSLVTPGLVRLIEAGALTANVRRKAGRHLARQGDPRDLEALVALPGGAFTMGSRSYPTSQPVARLSVGPFRMGRYPVTNALYARFVDETGRPWRTAEGRAPENANAPATDLTWRDALAYCAWLTARWRTEGRIGAHETVRLPTEPEWEYAARGDQPDAGLDIVYPWAGPWAPDHANSAETGFNSVCAVGLFPKGRTPSGLDDMSGQAWEWTTTLWGQDMATPSFAYPYADDGREALDAGPAIRRVLRGGCFSSGKLKACCTYRGSLEPDGFWRGNGFRIVVSDQAR
jgi:iron(II)-dependent oxidoreductase